MGQGKTERLRTVMGQLLKVMSYSSLDIIRHKLYHYKEYIRVIRYLLTMAFVLSANV